MYQVQNITDSPLQTFNLILPDSSSIAMTLYFIPMQFAWVITSLTYKTFVLNGLRISVSPNMLHQYRNQIPFGLACFSQNNREPTQNQDFESGAAQLFVLSAAEVENYEEFLVSGANG